VRPEHFGELRLRESSLPAAGGAESGAELLRPLAAYEAVTGGSW
jgi:hypothetical protein